MRWIYSYLFTQNCFILPFFHALKDDNGWLMTQRQWYSLGGFILATLNYHIHCDGHSWAHWVHCCWVNGISSCWGCNGRWIILLEARKCWWCCKDFWYTKLSFGDFRGDFLGNGCNWGKIITNECCAVQKWLCFKPFVGLESFRQALAWFKGFPWMKAIIQNKLI